MSEKEAVKVKCGYIRTQGWVHTKEGQKPTAKFCENCGADMRGERSEENI